MHSLSQSSSNTNTVSLALGHMDNPTRELLVLGSDGAL